MRKNADRKPTVLKTSRNVEANLRLFPQWLDITPLKTNVANMKKMGVTPLVLLYTETFSRKLENRRLKVL